MTMNFLPQDRVCEFAKLTPIQLLEETEKAVGDPDLPAQHNALVDKSRELKRLEVTVKQNSDILIREKLLNAEQEKDAKLMEKKVPWLKYDVKKVEYMQAKENEKKAKEKLNEAAYLLNDLNAPIEYGVQVQSKYDEMEDLRRQEESRQDRILRAKEDLATAELELAKLPVFEPPKDELYDSDLVHPTGIMRPESWPLNNQNSMSIKVTAQSSASSVEILRAQILELECSARQKKSQKIEKENLLAQKKELKEMENRNTKLLHALKNSGSEKVVEAYNWLKIHRGELRKEAYGPVLLEVNVPEQRHAAYLENHVAYYVWKSFITQDPDDQDFLTENLIPLDIPVLNYVASKSNKKKNPFEISEEMHGLGVYSRLDQVFDAPAVVKEVLLDQAQLDDSYIGSHETDQKADKAPRLGIFDLWTPDNHYRWTKSRYDGHISASAQAVTPSRLLLCGLDAGETERLKLKKIEFEASITGLEESLKALLSEQRQLEDDAAKLHRRRNVSGFVLDQRRRKLESLEKENDLEANTQKLIDQAAKLNKQRFQFAMDIKDLLIEAVSFKWSFAEKNMRCIEIDAKIKTMKQHVKDKEDAATAASMHFNHRKMETDKCREELSAAKSRAESIAVITPELSQAFIEIHQRNMEDNQDSKVISKLRTVCMVAYDLERTNTKMPSTLEDLEAAIQDVTSQANSIAFLNNDVLEQYERRQQKINSISTKLEADEKEMRRCLSEIDVLKVGERSVSTILYLVSLQDLTNCPFRVVDEINQAMNVAYLISLLDLGLGSLLNVTSLRIPPSLPPFILWSTGDCYGAVVGHMEVLDNPQEDT
ncbi:hypothetical protein ACLOJK_015891 [Asimina triloba]